MVDDSSGIVVNRMKATGRVWGNFPACPSVKNGDELDLVSCSFLPYLSTGQTADARPVSGLDSTVRPNVVGRLSRRHAASCDVTPVQVVAVSPCSVRQPLA